MTGINLNIWILSRRMLLSVMGFLAALIVLHQFSAFPTGSGRYFSESSPGKEASLVLPIRSSLQPGESTVVKTFDFVEGVDNNASDLGDEGEESGVVSDQENSDNNVGFGEDLLSMRRFRSSGDVVKELYAVDSNVTAIHGNETVNKKYKGYSRNGSVSTDFSAVDRTESVGTELNTLVQSTNLVPSSKIKQVLDSGTGIKKSGVKLSWKNDSLMLERYVRKMRGATITLSEMKSMLLNGVTPAAASTSMRRKWSSPRDRELVSASLQIKNAPVLRTFPDLHAPLFRNASMFKRSYELMVRLLKIYVYKEGERPIFHQPRVRGIYAAEGWFMKLIEKSKLSVVRDPKKAHLFYLPFSSNILRNTLHDHNIKDLEHYLSGYVDLIKKKHRFWNRTGGADHFLVACHDWGPRITTHMSTCIRALCNTNVARGFSIGRDVSVPVTYVRSGNEPTRDIGGKPPSERDILAFFAGQMHGYVRPLLLKYWENKVSDMKISGPMQRDVEGKAVYREYMKSSKFCICARGYGVHTPRVVESIFYECVPVIISDNYVPPFFEVLDWEAFAVFILEKDIPNLRNILLSIPEDRYFEMHSRVKMVQQHFIWHKVPEKYDLFHMILHSIWFSRVSQMS